MGAKRLKVFLFSAIAFVMLLGIALISVSLAKWQGGGASSVSVSSSTGLFYVDFPYSVQASATLDSDRFYLEVPRENGVSDYYYIGGTDYENCQVNNLYLKGGEPIYFRKGSNLIPKGSLSRSTSNGNNDYHGKVDSTKTYFIPSFDAFYNITFSNLGSDKYQLYVDTSYPNIVNLKFKDKTVKVLLSWSSINFHIWLKGPSTDKDITLTPTPGPNGEKKWPGTTCTAGYENTATTQGNTNEIDLSEYASTNGNIYMMFNHTSNSKVYKSYQKQVSTFFDLNNVNYISLTDTETQYASNDTDKVLTAERVSAPVFDIPYIGATESKKPIQAANDGSDDTIVRKASANNVTTYHNYVCVSRVDDNAEATMAYVNFGVTGADLSAGVTSFKVTRTAAKADGTLDTTKPETDETIYNSPEGKTLAAINSTKGGATGDHASSNYVEGGTYIMLFFGAGEKQYYALDVEITTSTPATFTLTATASNIDSRNAYQTGYGAPNGYYLGGTFNGIPMWDPRHVTKLEKSHSAENGKSLYYKDNGVPVHYSNIPSYIDVKLNIELTSSGDTFKLMRLGADGKRVGGTDPTLWFIPRNIYKNYTDGTTAEGGNNSPFNDDMNIKVANPGTYEIRYVGNVKYKYDGEMEYNGTTYKLGDDGGYYAYNHSTNEFVTKSKYYDEYTDAQRANCSILPNWNGVVDNLYIRKIVEGETGNVTVTFDTNGGTLAGSLTETVAWGGKLSPSGLIGQVPTKTGYTFDGWYDAKEGGNKYTSNTVITPTSNTLTLYAHYSEESAKEWEVTFDSDGGSTVAKQTITDGGKVAKPDDPTKTGYNFKHWYLSTDTTKSAYNFDTPVTGNITLKALWKKVYTVTFNSNGGSAVSSETVEEGNTVSKPSDPTRSGYVFLGWYTTSSGDTQFDFATTININTTIYAHWTNNYYVVNSGVATPMFTNPSDENEFLIKDVDLKANDTLKFTINGRARTHQINAWSYGLNYISSDTSASSTSVSSVKVNKTGNYDLYIQDFTLTGSTCTVYGIYDTAPNQSLTYAETQSNGNNIEKQGFLTGSFAHRNGSFDWRHGYKFSGSGNNGTLTRVYLEIGDILCVRYYGSNNNVSGGEFRYDTIKSGKEHVTYTGTDRNIKITKNGYYTFTAYIEYGGSNRLEVAYSAT